MYNVLHKRIHSNYIECPTQKNTFYCVSLTPKEVPKVLPTVYHQMISAEHRETGYPLQNHHHHHHPMN